MSISSDVIITRQKALEAVYDILINKQKDIVRRAVNSMSNDELASALHDDYYFYHVEGKGKIKADRED